MITIETLAPKLGDDVRVLRQDELDSVNGGFYNDNGCCPVITWGPGGIHVYQGSYNPWLTWGSPQRGGR
jgi:hypothetical protein